MADSIIALIVAWSIPFVVLMTAAQFVRHNRFVPVLGYILPVFAAYVVLLDFMTEAFALPSWAYALFAFGVGSWWGFEAFWKGRGEHGSSADNI